MVSRGCKERTHTTRESANNAKKKKKKDHVHHRCSNAVTTTPRRVCSFDGESSFPLSLSVDNTKKTRSDKKVTGSYNPTHNMSNKPQPSSPQKQQTETQKLTLLTMPSQQETLLLVRKILFYLSATSLALVLLSFTFSTAGAPSASLSIYDQSFLPMPQVALNLILLAFSLLHVKYALYFSSSSARPTANRRDSGSGITAYLQFLSEFKYTRHIRLAFCLAVAILLMGLCCYSYLIMLVTGNPSDPSTSMMLTTAPTTTPTPSICRVVDIQGRTTAAACLMQMIVGLLEGIVSLLLMFEGTSSFALHSKEGMASPTLRSQESYERDFELRQTARAGAPPRPTRIQGVSETVTDPVATVKSGDEDRHEFEPRFEYNSHSHGGCSESGSLRRLHLDNHSRLDLMPYQGYPVDEQGGVYTEDGLYYSREQIEHETRVIGAHRSQDVGQLAGDIAATQIQSLAPTATRSTRRRSRSRLGGIRPLPPSPHYSELSEELQNRYHAREDHQTIPQYLSFPEPDATLIRRPTRIPATLVALHRGPADPRSPIYYSPVPNNHRRRSLSMMSTESDTSSPRPVAPVRVGASLLQQLVDPPVLSHLDPLSGQGRAWA